MSNNQEFILQLLFLIVLGVAGLLLTALTYKSTQNNQSENNKPMKQTDYFLTPDQKDVIINQWVMNNGYVSNKAYQGVMRGKFTDEIQIYNLLEESGGGN